MTAEECKFRLIDSDGETILASGKYPKARIGDVVIWRGMTFVCNPGSLSLMRGDTISLMRSETIDYHRIGYMEFVDKELTVNI